MFSQYFGHYLLNRELITREQLMDALTFQKTVHVKLGVMAINEGYMTSLQVEEVHEKQKQVDKRFGEIAVELGYLTEEQVDKLISNQKQGHLFLAQALVDREYLTIEQFSAALKDYKKENSLSDDQFEAIRSGDIETLVGSIIDFKDLNGKDNYEKYLALFAKNMIRFIDDQVYIEITSLTEEPSENWLVYQGIVGEAPLFTAISANEKVFLHMASVYAEEELTEVDELAKDAVSEFLNLHNGIYLVNMSNWGTELTMTPQAVMKNATVSGDVFLVSVNTSQGPFQLLLSDKPENIPVPSY